MNQFEFLALLEKHPVLTAHGFGVSWRGPKNDVPTFNEVREDLANSFDAFQACVEWIGMHPDLKRTRTSYGFKHDVEKWKSAQGVRLYVPQGAFILAAIHKGYVIHRIRDSTSARFSKSKEVITYERKEQTHTRPIE